MKILKTSLVDEFKCIAADCKDSCCSAGWQIDVDKKTMQKYSMSNDAFIQSINNKIEHKNGSHYFKNDDMHKCPYFRTDGLCDIVCKKGDKFLCDVCKTFPRVYNKIDDRFELGLSLSCEEAVKILLESDKIYFVTDGISSNQLQKNSEFADRQKLIEYVQNPSLSTELKIAHLKEQTKFANIDFERFKAIKGFEWLRTDLAKCFSLCDFQFSKNIYLTDIQFENLLVNFLFEHYISPKQKYSKLAKLRFCLFSTLFCDWLAVQIGDEKIKIESGNNRTDIAIVAIKEYCREIENSQKNMDILLNFFEKTA